ncbi:MAG: helix-turn-helix transcriptional regulator [Bacteroidota bacterium]|nr:helix-turn-helix transcriptional regulator [Bacteroidota bacterium]
MLFEGPNNEYLQLQVISNNCHISYDKSLSFPLIFIWTKDECSELFYEGVTKEFPINTIFCFTAFHRLTLNNLTKARVIKFNREFYCVLDHDKDVSCKGILFYGANQLPYFKIPEVELEKFELLWSMFEIEMETKDKMQLEMLQTMLKRFIILCTRIYKAQYHFDRLQTNEADLIRDFNFLVEQYFKTKHTVKEYADLLYKSPKTINNLFAKLSSETPLEIIHNRKLLEARRLIRYTNKNIKEIAYELGFEDMQAFSRFFKKLEKISPSEFRKLQ